MLHERYINLFTDLVLKESLGRRKKTKAAREKILFVKGALPVKEDGLFVEKITKERDKR